MGWGRLSRIGASAWPVGRPARQFQARFKQWAIREQHKQVTLAPESQR